MTCAKPFIKRENQRYNLYDKWETRNTYEPHQQTTTTEHQINDLGYVQTHAAGLNVLIDTELRPHLKQ